MFSDLTDANGFGWWTEDDVAANIETLALLGRTVTPDLWDRSILEEVHGPEGGAPPPEVACTGLPKRSMTEQRPFGRWT